MKDPHGLMNPQPEYSKFRVTIELIKNVDSLDDFADISHIEDIMWFGWSWQEIISNRVIKTDRSHCQRLRNLFNIIIKILSKELMRKNIMKNPSNLTLRRESKVNHNKLCLYSSWYLITSSTWWTHWCYVLYVLNLFEDLVLGTVEPASVVHPLTEEL